MTMKLASLSETVTVSGESPMLEVSNPSNVLNISGEFQREMPIQARRNWSDFLEITPGVHSRPFDDGSGRMVYFGHSTEHFAHVVQLEGAIASNYQDAQITYVAMGADMVSDTQVKTGGVDASAPMGVGLNINVITKSGGNTFKGSGAFAYQPSGWNGNNVANCSTSASCKPATSTAVGTPTTAIIRQFDGGLGGPIQRDKIWFFGSVRRADLEAGISRTALEVQRLKAFFPNAELFNNTTESTQPYGKVTMQSGGHQIAAFVQQDRLKATGDREYNFSRTNVYSTGGGLYGGKITSVWGQRMTTTFLASYNNKGGSSPSTFDGWDGTGPAITIHQLASLTGGRMIGNGRLVSGGNFDDGNGQALYSYQPSTQITLRADLTYFKDGLAGSHEFQTGFFGAPRSTYDTTTLYLNNGFIMEEQRQVDANDPSKGTIPFHRRYATPTELLVRQARDRNFAVYVQDNWKPTPRLTANLGVRVDWVHRYDNIFNVVRENAHIVQPRLGFSYLVTKNAKNVLRGSYVRLGEQMMGRDAVTLFGATGAVGILDTYDLDSNGSFETSIRHAGADRIAGGFRIRPQPAPALPRRSDPRLPAAAAVLDRHRRGGHPSHLQRHVCAHRHQRLLPERAEPAVRRLRQGRSEPRHRLSADEQLLEPAELHGARADRDQEPVARLPVHGRHQPPVAAHERRLEPDRSGAVHPAGRVRERQAAVHAAREQRGKQPADHDRHHRSHLRPDVAEVPPEFRRLVVRAVRCGARGELHD